MPSSHITDAPPTPPPVPAVGRRRAGEYHRHGPSCFWQVEEARWSCEVSGNAPPGSPPR